MKGARIMASTGMTRRVDELGRVVIPIEIRRSLGIEQKDPLEIGVEGHTITLRKAATTCVFCGGEEGLTRTYRGQAICDGCWHGMHGAGGQQAG